MPKCIVAPPPELSHFIHMINPAWIWRALKDHSITFSALCVFTCLGWSTFAWIRDLVAWLGAPGYVIWITPPMLAAVIASKEGEWIPERQTRKRLAWGLLLAGIVLSASLSLFSTSHSSDSNRPAHGGEHSESP